MITRSRPVEFGIVGVIIFRVYFVLRNAEGIAEFTVSNKVLFSDAARILEILWIGNKKDSQKQDEFFVYSVFCFALLLMSCYYIIKM